ncbi:MAG: polynucleotide kinase-phosphatase [Actinomycetota bacterium]
MNAIELPELSLVVLVGISGSGKSTFAARHFAPTEVISSDACRALVGDDPNDQSVTTEAFEVLHAIASARLRLGRLTVIDATNVQPDARAPLVRLAREQHVLPIAIVLDVPEALAHERNASRPDREFGPHVIRRQQGLLRRSLRRLTREGFRRVFILKGPADIDAVEITRQPAWSDRSGEHGPFDIVGDIHGCHEELVELLEKLGYEPAQVGGPYRHAQGRKAVFLGDLVDRGPATPAVLRTVMAMAEAGHAICVPGNHERKLVRALNGKNVQITHGLAESLSQLEEEPEEFRRQVADYLDGLVSHFVLDDRKLVVAHACMREEMQGRASGAVRSFALYGETTGETDEFGLPVRYPWAEDYRGAATVVYGHTPVPEPEWINNTICIDTGCVFGGALTALRYPERELVSISAKRTYYEPVKPFMGPGEQAPRFEQEARQTLLDIEDVAGKRGVETRLGGRLTIPEDHAAAALEVMSRFAVDPRWLIYLPPTMAPTPTTTLPGLLEHPAEAFDEYRREGIPTVVCEEKHMGSRAVVIVCRSDDVGIRRFKVDGPGVAVTRTGRSFFAAEPSQAEFLGALRDAVDAAGLWDDLGTDWLAFDAELLPWSLKAEELLRSQYASVGAAATAAGRAAVAVLDNAEARGVDVEGLVTTQRHRLAMAEAFVDAYRPYCWSVDSLADVKLAPFQLLAGEGGTYVDREHVWHMGMADRLASAAPTLVRPTKHLVVDVTDQKSQDEAVVWWEALIGGGGEGMVVKPAQPSVRGRRGVVQPGIKVRGPEYLRIIYGPEYTEERNLERLRKRGLGRKRSLASREFALGVEALERFTRGEPLFRVHECVFGVLALESEPVDPRL